MARLWADATGKVIRFEDRGDPGEASGAFDEDGQPVSWASSIAIADDTNAALIDSMIGGLADFTLLAGVLRRGGAEIAIAPTLKRQPRKTEDIVTDLKSLPLDDLMLKLLAEKIVAVPTFATDEGIDVPGDELDV